MAHHHVFTRAARAVTRPMLLVTIASALLFAAIEPAAAQSVVLKRDNGVVRGADTSDAMWEETVIIAPAGPCALVGLQVYLTGTTPGVDSIWIVGDPSEGALPPTSNVWHYNALTVPVVVAYDGTPGWDTIDLRGRGVHYDGLDRIVIQHRISDAGIRFAIDNNGPSGFSVQYDPSRYPDGFPVAGLYFLAGGDFLVRPVVEYDVPNGSTSKPAPAPTLVDVARTVGVADSAGRALKGARASVVDWNGDGWDDIALGGLFFQNKGDGTFTNVTATIGIAAGASVWGDYDNDGRIDCYAVNGGAADRLYHNNGSGSFTDVTGASGLSNPYPTVTPIWFDADHDGRLDLFIANGRTESGGQEEYFPDQLWKGAGDGTFTRITDDAGINGPEMAGSPAGDQYLDCWGASPCDFDGDGWTDILVATYRLAPDLLYRNNHNGTFDEVGAASGVRGEPTDQPFYFGHGIGCDWGDFDNDGDMDVAIGNLGHPDVRGRSSNPSLVYRNDGGAQPTFTEVHRALGIKFFEMNAAVVWLDLDLDGWLDLWHCQYAYNPQGSGEPKRASRIYVNEGPGRDFHMKDMTWQLGGSIHGAWTAVRGDFDRDGDLDLLVASPTDAVRLFRNDVARRGSWLEFRLTGSPADGVSMDAYGTSITVHVGGMRFLRDLQGGGGGATASQNSNVLHFGIGGAATADSVVVRYANGVRRAYTNVAANASYTIPYNGDPVRTSGVGMDDPAIAGNALRVEGAAYHDRSVTFRVTAPAGVRTLHAELVDVRGAILATADVDAGSSATARIDVAVPPPAGTYFVRVGMPGASAVVPCIIVR